MHVFLTGEVQCGKTTIINKVLQLLPHKKVAGFRTFSVMGEDGLFAVYIAAAGKPLPALDENNRVGVRMGKGKGLIGYTKVFDSLGVDILGDSDADIIIMDEIGSMENQAQLFRAAVLRLLDGDTPILGVIKPRSLPLPDQVRYHPKVKVFTVNEDNRELLPEQIADLLR